MSSSKLATIHRKISECRTCEPLVAGFEKPVSMQRGHAGDLVVIGESPGATEATSGKAFSGPAGKRLDKWLSSCATSQDDPRHGVYLTSVVKCRTTQKAHLSTMTTHCIEHLRLQVNAIAPKIIITLGEFAYQALRTQLTWSQAVGGIFSSKECWLISPFDVPFQLVPWPHPSGLSRWTNNKSNQERLQRSIEQVRAIRQKDSQ